MLQREKKSQAIGLGEKESLPLEWVMVVNGLTETGLEHAFASHLKLKTMKEDTKVQLCLFQLKPLLFPLNLTV